MDFKINIRTDSRWMAGTHAEVNMKLKASDSESEQFFFKHDRNFHRGR